MKSKTCLLLLAVFLVALLAAFPVSAQPEEAPLNQNELPTAEYPSVAAYLFRIVISLLLIVILTYAVLRIIKKQSDIRQKQKGWIRLLDYQALGQNRGIYLAEMFERIYLLGVSDGQVSILLQVDRQSEAWQDLRLELEESGEVLPPGISGLLSKGWGWLKMTGRLPQTSFKNQLDLQLDQKLHRSRRLYQQAAKEDRERE